MKAFLIIGAMWSASNVMLLGGFGLLSWDSIQMPLTLLGLAAVLGLTAWVAAICHAVANDQGGWVLALVLLPISSMAMWCYIVWGIGKAAVVRWVPDPSAKPPAPSGPLVWRQALRVVEDAERRYPKP